MYLGYASSISNWYSSCIPSLLIVAYFFIASVSPTARPTYRKIVRYNKIKICKSKLRISSDSVTKKNDFSVSDWLNLLWNSSTSQIWKKNTSCAQHFSILGPPTPSAHNMWLRTVERSELCSLNPTLPSSKKSYIAEPLRVTERRGYNVPVNTAMLKCFFNCSTRVRSSRLKLLSALIKMHIYGFN